MRFRTPTVILLILLIVCSSVLSFAEEEEELVELSVNVPFGITTGEEPIPVLNQARKGTEIDMILPDHICAVDKAEVLTRKGSGEQREKWFHIYYFSAEGAERVGTVSGRFFSLFTIEELVTVASDPESMGVIQALLALPEISATKAGNTTLDVDMSGIGFSRNQPVTDDSPIKYVLNTSTKKIHAPSCESVDKIKLKNRKDIFEVEEVISYMRQGYKGCKNCNPSLPGE